ncbi:MAG: OmpA family protein [Flavobacteriales bacterium]|nr:OmpA family protein [Flavobacteriales bacterium]
MAKSDDAKNLTLSEKRAASVRDYLTEGEWRCVSTSGHGETAPVADNGTSAGRAKNRRVEFKVMF